MKRLFLLISLTWSLIAFAQPAIPHRADTVRILGVGNSWTRDSMRWLSAITKSAGRPVIVGHAYLGGSTLEDQWHGISDTVYCYIHNKEPQRVHSTYQYWKYSATEEPVKTPDTGYKNGRAGIGVTLEYAVKDEPWDWIVFQPESTLGGDYMRHLGYGTDGYSLLALIRAVKGMMSPEAAAKVRVGLMVPYAYAQGNTDYRKKFLEVYNDSKTPAGQAEWDSLYRKQHRLIQTAASTLCRELSLDACINVGAAIEAARQDPELSRCGYLLQRRQDNTHLAEGIPKYIASFCYASTLFGIRPEDVRFCPPGEDASMALRARLLGGSATASHNVSQYLLAGLSGSDAVEACLRAQPDSFKVLVFDQDIVLDRAILLPSHTLVIIDGCTIRQADGCFDNVFRGANVALNEGDLTWIPDSIASLEDIRIIGRGNARILGPDRNRIDGTRFMTGDAYGGRTVMLNFCFVRNMEVSGLRFQRTRGYAINFEYCEDVAVHDIEVFNMDMDRNRYGNGDGVDIRSGCRRFRVWNITGESEDDLVAINTSCDYSALPGGYPLEFSHRYGILLAKENPRAADISDIKVENIIKDGGQFHAAILFAQHGHRIHDIRIIDVEIKGRPRRPTANGGAGWVAVYSYKPETVQEGDIYNVSVSGIQNHSDVPLPCFASTLPCKNLLLADVPQSSIPHRADEDCSGIMSSAYWERWNDDVQSKIDADIDRYRKADGEFRVGSVKKGSSVKVEQVGSDFQFGASSFNYGQLGTTEMNNRYKDLFGTLFNRATVGLYWRDYQWFPEMPMRFKGELRDSETYWNNYRKKPYVQPHWRRPASDPVVEWCASRGVAVHLHPLTWGSLNNSPSWLHLLAPEGERAMLDQLEDVTLRESKAPRTPRWDSISQDSLAILFPAYGKALGEAFDAHVREIIAHYKDNPAVVSYDVVNESCKDWRAGRQIPGSLFTKSRYSLLPGDYTRRTWRIADEMIPAGQTKCINDYVVEDDYPRQIQTLLDEGFGVQAVGSQMHLFEPELCRQIAEGADIQTPEYVWDLMRRLSAPGLPTCISEITITAPYDGERGEMVQAIIARNLYRIWFSGEKMFAITWWNLVDGCGFPGEPSTSGLFYRDMTPKAAYYALDELINHEWKTSLEVKPSGGVIRWRGFKGNYRISWTDAKGKEHCETVDLR